MNPIQKSKKKLYPANSQLAGEEFEIRHTHSKKGRCKKEVDLLAAYTHILRKHSVCTTCHILFAFAELKISKYQRKNDSREHFIFRCLTSTSRDTEL